MIRRQQLIAYSAVIILINVGTRSAISGLFQIPITDGLEIGRSSYGLAIAIQNIIVGLPIIGILADRYGSRWVGIGGGLLYAVGAYFLAQATTTLDLYIWLGGALGLALGATSYVVVLGALAQVVPAERQSTVFGIFTALGSLGIFIMSPGIQWSIDFFGWRETFWIITGMALLMAVLAISFPGRRREESDQDNPLEENRLAKVIEKALRHRGYWLLNLGFFVCGFHVAFISTHLPAYLSDNGISGATIGWTVALIGLFNMFGSALSGYLGDHLRKKYLLAVIYLGRALLFAAFLLLPLSDLSAIAFGSAMGFLWLATVPLTSGMVAQIFGSRYLSTLYGIVFFSHQIGAFIGSWYGGRLYDQQGDYYWMWIIGIGLGVVAFFAHLPITDRPLRERGTAVPSTS